MRFESVPDNGNQPHDQNQTSLAKTTAPAAKELEVRRPPGGYPAYSRYPPIEVEKNSLREYWRVIRSHKWVIITTLVVLTTTVTIGTMLTRPVYRAEVKVEVGKETERPMTGPGIATEETANVFNPLYLQTQVDILHSRDLARRVIQRLKLAGQEEFQGKAAQAPAMNDNERDTRLVNAFQRRYAVEVGRLSRVVSITFDAHSPQLAAEVAQAVADEYIEWSMENRFQGVDKTRLFLQERVREAEAALRKSEDEFRQYAARHQIISLDGEKGNITLERASELNRQLIEVQNERRHAEALYRKSLEAAPDELPPVITDATVQSLTKELSKQKQELANLSARYQPSYPAVKQVQEQITQLDSQLEAAKRRIVKNIETQYQVARRKEESLIASFSQSQSEAIQKNNEAIGLNLLRQRLETDRKNYDDLLQRLRRAGVESEFRPSNIRIVQRAEVPIAPVKPNKPLNIGLSLIVGLALGIGLAFFLEYLDNTINTAEDVERFVHLPPLGAIPSLQSLAKRRMSSGHSRPGAALARSQRELLSAHEMLSSFAEAYRALRTSLLLSSAEHAPRTILITSSHPAEGKTTIVANTAISLAQTGSRVLVLDADMRRPRCHKILNVKNEVGLSSYLSRKLELDHLLQEVEVDNLLQDQEIPNLHVLAAGPVPPNPSELLSSHKLRVLIEELRDKFDHIVIDSPPVINVTDALIISPLVDGVVLVIKGGQTPREAVLRAKQALADVNAKIFGVVLNCIDLEAESYYYNYKYSYYSSYEGTGQ